jgi:hypothetical protein
MDQKWPKERLKSAERDQPSHTAGRFFFVEQPQIWKLRRDFLIFTAV